MRHKIKTPPLRKPRIPKSLLWIGLFAAVTTTVLLLTSAATPVNNAFEPEAGNISGGATSALDTNASGASYVSFQGAPATCPAGQSGIPPNCSSPSTTWTWPTTLSNTGPAAGTAFTAMAPRDFTAADNGKTFDGFQMNVTSNAGITITGSNITFKNCKIIYTGTAVSENGFLYLGVSYDKTTRPKNIIFDHCTIDDGNRFEYNVRAYYAQFSFQYSQIRGGSHNIDSGGDLDPGTTISIYRSYIYDYDDKPFDSSAQFQGHAANIYFTGNNGTVNIEDNTIIGNRWEACNGTSTVNFSAGPGGSCRDNSSSPPFNGTGSVVVYAGEDSNPDKIYIVKHNRISGSSYAPLRFYGEAPGIQSVSITNNEYTAQSGYPTFSLEGQIYVFDSTAANRTLSGNSWGTDTVCYTTPASCKGSPNSPN